MSDPLMGADIGTPVGALVAQRNEQCRRPQEGS